MNPDFDTLTDGEIIGVLQRAGVVPRKGSISLQRYPIDHSRKDGQRRMTFRVWAGSEAILHLMVGQGLAGLHRLAVDFSRHNPDISARTLFFVQHARVDYLGQECAGLFNLEEALASRRIDATRWQQAVGEVAARLAATAKASTVARQIQEMADFEAAVLAISSFARIDTIFLRETVFPLIRQEATRLPPATAWTNGDFIARNILLDAAGRPRLVDYEFARRTHFPQADWFRLRHFSSVPSGIQPESLGAPGIIPPWLEIRCWLEHAVKLDQVCVATTVQRDLPKLAAHLMHLVETAGTARPPSVFFDLTDGIAPASSPGSQLADLSEDLLIEWSAHGAGAFKAEPPVALKPNTWNEVQADLSGPPGRTLQLRLRLPTSPCVLEVRTVEVYGPKRDKLLWTVDSQQLDKVLTCTGNLLSLPTAEGLGIVNFGGESHVALPPVRLNRAATTAGLALWIRYVPNLQDFSQRLRRAFAEGDAPAFLSDGRALAQIEPAADTAKSVVAQLFVPDGANFTEENSERRALPEVNAWTELTFELPPLPEGAIIRFDPTDQPGLLELASLTVEPKLEGNRPAGPGQLRSFLESIKAEGDALLVAGDDGSQLLIFGDDPILKLAPMPASLANRPCRMTVGFRFLTTAPTVLWAQALKEKNSVIINFNVRLHQASLEAERIHLAQQQTIDREATTREASEKALAEARAGLASRQTEIESLRSAFAQQNQELAGLHARQEAVLRRIEEEQSAARQHATQALGEARAEVARLKDELAARERTVAALRDSESKLASGLEGIRTENTRLTQEIAGLQSLVSKAEEEKSAGAKQAQAAASQLEQAGRELAAARAHSEQEAQLRRQQATTLGAAEADLARLRAELVTKQAAITAARAEAAAIATGAKARTTELAQELAAARQELGRALAQLAVVEQQGKTAAEDLARKRAELSASRQAMETARLELERLREENSVLNATALAERQSFDQRDQTASAELDRLARQQAALEQTLAEFKLSREELEARYAHLLESLHAQNSHLLDVKQNAALLAADRDTFAADLKTARARIEKLTSAINHAGQRLLIRLDVQASRSLKEATLEPAPGPAPEA